MTVKELVELLQQEDPTRIVVLSRDSEGNGYSEARHCDTASFDERDREIGLEVLTQEDIDEGYSEEDVMSHGVPALVLWP